MNAETAKATISAAAVIIVNVLAVVGFDVDGTLIANILCVAAAVIASGYACWKNHNFTSFAQMAQSYLTQLKLGEKEGDVSDTDAAEAGE